jgi:hypothetical protein
MFGIAPESPASGARFVGQILLIEQLYFALIVSQKEFLAQE